MKIFSYTSLYLCLKRVSIQLIGKMWLNSMTLKIKVMTANRISEDLVIIFGDHPSKVAFEAFKCRQHSHTSLTSIGLSKTST